MSLWSYGTRTPNQRVRTMRVVPLLVLLVCGLSVSVAPDLSTATEPAAPAVVSNDAGQVEYEALQRQADLALDMLRQARERRLATAQLAAN